jgi:hypothetical protein
MKYNLHPLPAYRNKCNYTMAQCEKTNKKAFPQHAFSLGPNTQYLASIFYAVVANIK